MCDDVEQPRPAWVIHKTSGGYGVMKPADGSAYVKPTVIRPETEDGARRE